MRVWYAVIVICCVLALAAMAVFAPLLFGARALTDDERAAAVSVFGDSVDFSAVRIKEGGLLTWTGAGVTIGNTISFPRGHYDGSVRGRAWLVHELTHVWQYQHGGPGYILRSVWEQLTEDDAYDVRYAEGKEFADYDIEEQAVIVAEWYATGDERYRTLVEAMRTAR